MNAINKDLIQNQALDAIGSRQVSGVAISMGVGKCLIGLRHMQRRYHSSRQYLVVVPKKSIINSWVNDAKKFNLEHLLNHITFVTYRSLCKCRHIYDFIYLDEVHSLTEGHNQWLFQHVKLKRGILGLTGTYPTYKHGEKGKMCNYYAPLVYSYSPDEAVDDGILNDYRIYVHGLRLSDEKNITKQGKTGTFTTSEESDYVYWSNRVKQADDQSRPMISIQRMKLLQSFETKVTYAKHLFEYLSDKTILFANTQKQADLICNHSYHSSNKQSEDNLKLFAEGTILKLSAVEQLSEGVTIPELKAAIIMHSYSNNVKSQQKIGRVLRLNPHEIAVVHILCYLDTIDQVWVTNALKELDSNKITWVAAKTFK